MKVLVAVDLQNDFINGALGTAEAAAMLPRAERKLRSFEGLVLFTRDTHTEDYLNTREGKALPVPHCIRGSHGWQLAAEELVDDAPHFYEIIAAKRGSAPVYSAAECAVGPLLLAQEHPLLGKQLERQLATCRQLLENMGRCERARASE